MARILFLLAFLFSVFLPSSEAAGLPVVPIVQQPPPKQSSLWDRILDFNPFRWSTGRSKTFYHNWWENEQLLDQLRVYEDHFVIRFNVSTLEDEASLRRAIDRMLVDVWDFTDNYADVRLESEWRISKFLSMLPEPLRSSHSMLIRNLGRAIADSYPSATPEIDSELQLLLHSRGATPTYKATSLKTKGVDDLFFQDYQPLAVISTWMRLLESMFRGRGLVRMISIGKSYEGRDIPALRVGLKNEQANGRRHTILITGGVHAREWISTSTVNYVAWSFITSVDSDPMIARILEQFDIVFIPVMNPDGYEYTWEVDRLWRKSRQPTSLSICPGFDLDHAFGYRWEAIEHQDEECSQSYGGHVPFEAVEACQLADWARNQTQHGTNFVGFLDLHSYSQQVLIPYEYSCDVHPPNDENLQEVAYNLAKHMRLANGEVYTVASACEGAVAREQASRSPLSSNEQARIENRGGSIIDYIFHEFGARYSYQIKLRDTGSFGFLLPSENIVPTGEEVFQAMKYFGDYLLGNNGHEWTTSAEATTAPSDQVMGEERPDLR
jgi:extracellular matrix protein 14